MKFVSLLDIDSATIDWVSGGTKVEMGVFRSGRVSNKQVPRVVCERPPRLT